MRHLLILVKLSVFVVLVSPALASTMTIDDHAAEHAAGISTPHTGSEVAPGLSISGTWTEGYYPGNIGAVGGGYSWPANPATDTATYTPGQVSGFEAGLYDVYVSWGVWSGNTGATYTVNHTGGTQVVSFDNTDNASQGSASGLQPNTAGSGSGFSLLGTFELDALSNVIFSGAGQIDALMIRSQEDGRFLDHQSANLVTNNPAGWMMAPAPTVPSGNYFYSIQNNTVAWTDLVDKAGTYDVKVSWGVHEAHSDRVNYLVDIDGNGQQDEGDTLITINQMLTADQVTSGSAVWSDYCDLGSFVLTADSQVLQWNDYSTYVAMTVAPMLVTPVTVPEPSTLVLLLTLGFFAYGIRTHKKMSNQFDR